MKTRLIFMILLIVCFSCATNNKPVSDAQQEKIKAEVKEVVNTYLKYQEAVNTNMIMGSCLDSPDFVFTYDGNTYGYKQLADMAKSVFGTLKNQKITVTDEKYAVLDNSTVMVTVINKCMINYKDGHSVLQDPWISQFTFKKTDNKWKIISESESGVEKNVPGETSKELNQVELMKQIIGNWKCEIAKDTIIIAEMKSFKNGGIEGNQKWLFKDKILFNEKFLSGYDKKSDKYIVSNIKEENPEILQMALWFTSKNTCIRIPFEYISNPEQATSKMIYEFKSHDLMELTIMEKNKPDVKYNWVRVKI